MNFATYVEPIAVRDEPEPDPELEIVITGGLQPDDHENFATVGDALIEREDGELIEDFQRRARDASRAVGHGFVTFGGLPKMNVSDDECETKGE